MQLNLEKYSSHKYRWHALVVLALGLSIVIIDNTVLNVSVPYILRDLNTSIDAIQWVISGYALIIATFLITVGRLADMFGRKKIFMIGTFLFAVGSYIASIAPNATILFIGEAFIEAIGAAMMLTSTLSLLVSEFKGRERAIAFGVWGSVAGASASLGPLLGGYFTTYYSWRWSLRINVFVAIVALLGSVFIKESKGRSGEGFDWPGTFYSCLGLFSLVFGFIEGRRYGWFTPNEVFAVGDFTWPFQDVSVITFAFLFAILLLTKFAVVEYLRDRDGKSTLLKLGLFKNRGFSLGLLILATTSLGQFGVFFLLTLYLQNTLGLNAFQTGLVFLWTSVTLFIVGPLSGILASKINPKWVVTTGMVTATLSIFLLIRSATSEATALSLGPALVLFGAGLGMSIAQLTNMILSSTPQQYAGEASALNNVARQVGVSIGVAVIGVLLVGSLHTNIKANIENNPSIPSALKQGISATFAEVSIEGSDEQKLSQLPPGISEIIRKDSADAFARSTRQALMVSMITSALGAFLSFFMPLVRKISHNGQKT